MGIVGCWAGSFDWDSSRGIPGMSGWGAVTSGRPGRVDGRARSRGIEIVRRWGRGGGEASRPSFGRSRWSDPGTYDSNEDGVAGGPGVGVVASRWNSRGRCGRCDGDGGVDSAGVDFQPVLLVGRQGGDCAVGGGTNLECALQAVMVQHVTAKNGGHLACCIATQQIHLPEAVLRGDVALGEDEVVE